VPQLTIDNSAHQVRQSGFRGRDKVIHQLKSYEIPVKLMGVEVTEGVLVFDFDAVSRVMEQLAEAATGLPWIPWSKRNCISPRHNSLVDCLGLNSILTCDQLSI
jgi:hypothetical protein